MNSRMGSLWNIWDLHVHTPSSVFNHYGPDNDATWEKYIDDLENLPREVKVLGINDYIFVDGYRKLRAERDKGRLDNIELLLPVIELRIDKFGGSKSKLSRVNFHVIFSNEVDPDTIDQQFLKTLPSAYKLSPAHEELQSDWNALATRESLIDLGERIIASVPKAERKNFHPPLIEGFNNINFSLPDIKKRLDSHYFEGKHLTAVGKTEWAEINWNDKSIADKKTIINSADIVFTAAENAKSYRKAKRALANSRVNQLLLDCSDAHDFSNSSEKDRIGNCLTWVKSDTTFDGLRLVLVEAEERIFVGESPEILKRVNSASTKYVRSIEIGKHQDSSFEEAWFDTELHLNHGLVAIIGNRGSGKSALADVMGLLGNSRNEADFSFLNPDKFRKPPEKKAQHFDGTLTWESEDRVSANLMEETDINRVERIKYIPQNYFEKICNELGDIEETAFDQELKDVIFSHVPEGERLGKNSLDELISYKAEEIYDAIRGSRAKLSKINKEIAELEARLLPEYRQILENELAARADDLKALESSAPEPVEKPDVDESDDSDALDELEEQKSALVGEKEKKEKLRDEASSNIAALDKLLELIEAFEISYGEFLEDFQEISAEVEIDVEDIVSLTIDKDQVVHKKSGILERREMLDSEIGESSTEGLTGEIASIDEKISEIKESLDEEAKAYQEYLESMKALEEKKEELIGTPKKQGSIRNLESRIKQIDSIPERLAELRQDRENKTRWIYKKTKQLANILSDLYEPIQSFFESHGDISRTLNLEFDVSIVDSGLQEGFFEFISRSAKGSFIGSAPGASTLQELIDDHDLNNETSTIDLIEQVVKYLNFDMRSDEQGSVSISDQLKKGKAVADLYQFLYSLEYIAPRYVLKLDGMELTQLSPGQRGALLIVFYLLIDKDRKPLIIDQPEHNLDNETVTEILVPTIRKAKKRRQLILVTHNPILAVVCNADQVISCDLDIAGDYSISYTSGAIENPEINRRIVDILEGTMIAFNNRQQKYLKEFFAGNPLVQSDN